LILRFQGELEVSPEQRKREHLSSLVLDKLRLRLRLRCVREQGFQTPGYREGCEWALGEVEGGRDQVVETLRLY
jgi:hypothetical protein